MKKLSLAIALAAGLLAGAAQAAPVQPGFYAGAGVGYSNTSIAAPAGTDVKGDNASLNFYGGYRFNRYLGAELGYTHLGDARVSRGGADVPLEGDLFSLSALGYYPLPHNVTLFGRAGVAERHLNFLGSSDTSTVALLGAGAEYQFNKTYAVRTELQYIPNYAGGGSHLINAVASVNVKF
jgi:OOP family OmpA-OmpF porin